MKRTIETLAIAFDVLSWTRIHSPLALMSNATATHRLSMHFNLGTNRGASKVLESSLGVRLECASKIAMLQQPAAPVCPFVHSSVIRRLTWQSHILRRYFHLNLNETANLIPRPSAFPYLDDAATVARAVRERTVTIWRLFANEF